MAVSSPKLTWCIVRLGGDTNWWVEQISDEVHWDLDALSILDPRQIAHVIDLVDPLRDYGFKSDLIDGAFYRFTIEKDLGEGRILLKRTAESLLESDEPLFALPDVMDEERGSYADFLDHVTKLRLKMLNDLIDFDHHLTADELEEELRERQGLDYMEGRAAHVFEEVTGILEYVPDGYELELDEVHTIGEDAEDVLENAFPDVADDEESIEEDETMRWDEDEEEDDFDEDEVAEGDGEDDEEEE